MCPNSIMFDLDTAMRYRIMDSYKSKVVLAQKSAVLLTIEFLCQNLLQVPTCFLAKIQMKTFFSSTHMSIFVCRNSTTISFIIQHFHELLIKVNKLTVIINALFALKSCSL